MIRHRLDRSWFITWTAGLLVLLALVISMAFPSIVEAIEPVPAFRIVDVRPEQGQLVVEVQHFYPNGNHWFYELYTWQGREAYKYPRVTNEAGDLLLEDNTIAPYGEPNELGISYQYIGYDKIYFEKTEAEGPNLATYKVIYLDNAYANLQTDYFGIDSTKAQVLQYQGQPNIESDLVWEYRNGPDWKRHDYPFLDETSILEIISSNHSTRLVSNWTGDRGRTVLPTFNFNMKDQTGAKALVERFEYLAFTYIETQISSAPPFEQLYNREHTPKTFTIEGQEYSGDTSILPPIQLYFEVIDLRTKDTKTYQLGNQSRTTVFQKNIHFETDAGDWETSSLRFWKVTDEDLWIMNTHPSYTIVGTPNHISMVNSDEEVGARWYTPSVITYEEDSAWYEYDGLRWTYSLTGSGIKLTSEALSPRGPKEYPFVFLPLGSTNPLRIDDSGNATTAPEYDFGDLGPDGVFFYYDEYAEFDTPVVVVPKAIIIGADGEYYPGGDWEIVDDYTIKFAFDDNSLPAQAFPYVIDPTTTFSLSGTEDDGQLDRGGSSFPPDGTIGANTVMNDIYVINADYGSTYGIQVGAFRWDTSSIPDDVTVTAASWTMYIGSAPHDTDGRNLVGSYRDWGTLGSEDYTYFPPSSDAFVTDLTILTASAYHTINLDNLNNINLYGHTGFMVHIDGGLPGGSNRVKIADFSNGSGYTAAALSVTYSTSTMHACQGSTSIFYSSAGTAGTAADSVNQAGGFLQSWSGIHEDTGNIYSVATGTVIDLHINSGAGNQYHSMARVGLLFDTTSLPDDAVVTSAVLSTVGQGSYYQWAVPKKLTIVSFNPASDSTVTTADYELTRWGTDYLMDEIVMNTLVANRTARNLMHLNNAGRAYIDPLGITRLGLRITDDVDDIDAWEYDRSDRYSFFSADETSSGDKRPQLIIDYITPCITLGGQAGSTTTVSNNTTSTFYSESGNDVDGKANNNTTNQKWHQFVSDSTSDLAADTASPLSTIIATGPSTGNFQDLAVAFLLFDTQALPDYGCEPTGTTGELYPQLGGGGSNITTDGRIRNAPGYKTWRDINGGTATGVGTDADYTGYENGIVVGSNSGSSTGTPWNMVDHLFFTFDTSGIPDEAILTSGTFSVHRVNTGVDTLPGGDSIALVQSFQAADNILTTADFAAVGGVRLADDILLATGPAVSAFWNYELNSAGLDSIEVLANGSGFPDNGISKFALIGGSVATGVEPTYSSGAVSTDIAFNMADKGGTAEDPKLVINYALPCDDIHSATFDFVTTTNRAISYPDIFEGYISLVSSNPASDTAIATTDLDLRGSVRLADNIRIDGLVDDSTTYTIIALNDAGIANLDDAGISKFALASSNLIDNIDPTGRWQANKEELVEFLSSEGGSGTRPKLSVVHGDASVAHIDAGDINAGGKTIVLTLNGANWRPAGTGAGQFDNTRQDIIDGITGSHGSASPDNWNQAVRDNIPVGDVIRTGDDTVTITFAAATYSYAPATTETITATINEGITNPTETFEPPTDADDGAVLYQASSGSGWPPATCNWTGTAGDNNIYHTKGGNYNMANAIVRWNTASLLDDVEIVSAKLRVYLTSVTDNEPTDVNIVGEWYDYDGSLACDNGGTWPPVGDAFIQPVGETFAGRHFTIPLNSLDEISLTGYTGLKIMIDTAATTDPSTSWYFQGKGGSSSSAGDDPQLIVTYSTSTTSNLEITSNPVFLVDPVPFNFTSFTPTMTTNSGTLQMTITGVGLPAYSYVGGIADVTLIKTGQTNIDCTGVSDNAPTYTSLVVNCIVDEVATGDWDVYLNDGVGNDDTKSAALTIFEFWSSTVNGGSFSESGSDYAVFAHTASPYFTVQAFDEVDKEWDSASSPPATIPAAAGMDGQLTISKDRLVIGTAANANYLWAYEFDKATGVISGTPDNPASVGSIGVNDFDIGLGDNILVAATTDSAGVYMYDIDEAAAIASFFTSTLGAPGTPPGAECKAVDINAAATYVAVGCTTSPWLHVWAITNGANPALTPAWGTKVTVASDLPDGAINGIKFSADGTQIAIAIDASPYVEVYAFNPAGSGTIGAKSSVPSSLPDGIAYSVDWLKESTTGLTNLAVAHAGTPFVSVYPFTTNAGAAGTFGTKIGAPSTPPTGTPTSVGFHPNDDTIFVGHATDPFVTAYNFTGVSDDDYRTYRYMANFDTSYLPDDAVITAATLSIYIDSVNAATSWNLSVQDGVNGTEPLIVGDYDYLKYAGGSLGSLASGSMTTSAYNDIVLSSFGAIIDNGITQLILRHDEDRTPGTAPTGVETIDIEVGGSGTFPTACKTNTSFPDQYLDSDYSLCNSVNVPKLTLVYTSVSAGAATTSVTWTNAQEAALAPTDQVYTIEVLATGNILGLRNGTLRAVTYNRNIVNNASDWEFWTSSSPDEPFPYTEYITYEVDGTQELWYQLNEPPSYFFTDRSGEDNHSTSMSFPLADNINITVDTSTPSGEDLVPDVSAIALPSLLGDIGTFGLNAEGKPKYAFGDPVSSPGWTNVFDRASSSMGLETNTILGVMILFIAVILGLGAYIATGNPIITIVGCGIALMAGVTMGVFPVYYLIMFVVIGVATVGISRSV